MERYTINLFMWGFQAYFQISLKVRVESLFETLDPDNGRSCRRIACATGAHTMSGRRNNSLLNLSKARQRISAGTDFKLNGVVGGKTPLSSMAKPSSKANLKR